MVESTGNVNTRNKLSENTSISSSESAKTDKAKDKAQVSGDEFLQILVTQLKSQDPLDPMKNDQFAVDLAQFSQLEQLVSINDKIGGSGNDVASLAGYLGQDVILDDANIKVEGGKGGSIETVLEQEASSITVEILDAQGTVVNTQTLGSMKAGRHTIDLENIEASDGAYTVRMKSLGTTGIESELKARAIGRVTGFIPGADPKLIINGQEISPGKVVQVRIPQDDVESGSAAVL
jgi:flagellar basal-body rod modification protein FlgD